MCRIDRRVRGDGKIGDHTEERIVGDGLWSPERRRGIITFVLIQTFKEIVIGSGGESCEECVVSVKSGNVLYRVLMRDFKLN